MDEVFYLCVLRLLSVGEDAGNVAWAGRFLERF
jgi:hypothetical protein